MGGRSAADTLTALDEQVTESAALNVEDGAA